MKVLIIIFVLAAVTVAHKINIRNNCKFTVWPGICGNPGKGNPLNGGFQLPSGQSKFFSVNRGWVGRVWGRTGCNSSGRCATGDCGAIQCNGRSGEVPATLVEIQFDGSYGLDFYDVSNVDGFNLPMSFRPTSGFKYRTNNKYDCKKVDCIKNLNANCPANSAKKSGAKTVACYNRDPSFFKRECPLAYSYDYDDQTSTFTCAQNPETNYEMIFCP